MKGGEEEWKEGERDIGRKGGWEGKGRRGEGKRKDIAKNQWARTYIGPYTSPYIPCSCVLSITPTATYMIYYMRGMVELLIHVEIS